MTFEAPSRVRMYKPPTSIDAAHVVSAFSSGNRAMDRWLKSHAVGNEGKASRTYVVTDEANVVIAYYSLAMGGIHVRELPRRFRHDNPTQVPVTILGRLAVDGQHAGRGLGSALLREAMQRTVQVGRHVGVRALLVHAVDEFAERFYRRYAFIPLPGASKTLILPLESIEAAVRG